MKIAYIFRHPPAYIRSTKECNALVQAGHEVTFIGWDFLKDAQKKHDMLPQVRLAILYHKGDFGRFSLLGWARWYHHLLHTLLQGRFDAVHCVDEYPVLMLWIFKHVLFRRIVLDVYDSIIKREAKTPWRSWTYAALRFIANSASDRIIETSEDLLRTLGRFARKSLVIYNSPEDPWPWIEGIFPEASAPVRIAATGGIHSKSMALETLLKVLDEFEDGKCEVVCTGWLQDEYARTVFAKHPKVKYRWIEKQEDYYRTLAHCDLVYNVRVDAANSHYRSLVFPNKIFDALAVGRPVLVALENHVSRWVVENGAGYACSFKDADAMRNIFQTCLRNRPLLERTARARRNLFLRGYQWNHMAERLNGMYAQL